MRKFYKFFIITLFLAITASSTVLASPKKRIISLTPASTEILFALGLKDEIIAVSSYCSWPIEAKNKEKIGSFSSPNIEKIILLNPDLVILTGMEQEHLKKILSSLGIEYIVSYPSNLNELILSIKEIGDTVDRKNEANILASSIENTIRGIKKKLSGVSAESRPDVYLEIWHDPIMSPGEKSFVSDMIEKAGGRNITKDLKRAYSKIDPEHVICRNPDIIILAYMKSDNWIRETFIKRIGFSNLRAVKNNRIYSDINPDIILRPGPRIGEGLIELHKRFYEN